MNKKPKRIATNPSPFNQNEVNFVETMFYDELAPAKEYPISRALGAPILEEEDEESNNHDLRNLFDKKRQKKEEAISSDSRQCVIVQKLGGMAIYRLWRNTRLECSLQEGLGLPSCMIAQEEISKEHEDMEKETQIMPKEELEEVNLEVDLGNPKPILINSQLPVQEKKQLLEPLKKYEDDFAWTYDKMPRLYPRLVVHSFNVDLGTKPVIQPARVFHTKMEA